MRRGNEEEFEREIMQFLRTDYPENVKDIPPDVFRLMVQNGIARARSNGLTWRYSISMFVSLMFLIAPNFDEHPIIRRRLSNPVAEPDYLIDSVVDVTTPDEWLEAGLLYDHTAWGTAAEMLPENWRQQ